MVFLVVFLRGEWFVGASVHHKWQDRLRRRFAAARFVGPRWFVSLLPEFPECHLFLNRRFALLSSNSIWRRQDEDVFWRYQQVHYLVQIIELFRHQQIALIPEYKSAFTCFGHCTKPSWASVNTEIQTQRCYTACQLSTVQYIKPAITTESTLVYKNCVTFVTKRDGY